MNNEFIYQTGKYRAVVDLNKGGELNPLEIGGQRVINRYWMHSSPEGAPDGSDAGYEMRMSDSTVVTKRTKDTVEIEGRLCQSNGSGRYFGHRYRRTYQFHPWGFECKHDLWVSQGDIDAAKREGLFEQWNGRPPMFYVWAIPLDVDRLLDHWNCGWNGCWDTYNYAKFNANYRWGKIPAPEPGHPNNRGYTALPNNFDPSMVMTIFQPNGVGVRREIVEFETGGLDQLNVWYNTPHDVSHTIETSVIGGDRKYIDSKARYLTPLCQESYDTAPQSQKENAYNKPRHTHTVFTERVTLGRADGAGNLVEVLS